MENSNLNAREYQQKSIELIREQFQNGNRKVLLWLATGGGKTFIFSKMIKSAAERGMKALVVVRGRKLVDQASQRLIREKVEHGVLMANHWNYRPHLPVQVCSIDTMISRGLRPPADLIVVDEAHMSTSEGYVEFLQHYPCFIVSVTATPWCSKSLRHVADSMVHPVTMEELIELGFLVPFRIFAPDQPDLSSVHISSSTKDYVTRELETAMVKGQLTGNIVSHYQKHCVDRPTLLFAVNIRHSRILTERFQEAGVVAEHCDADTSDAERNQIIDRLQKGITKVVCNVGILSTGVDIPRLGAVIMARPTKSRNLFIQQAGRGTRPFEGKEDCLLLDHAGNTRAHGLPTDEDEVDLDGKPIGEKAARESKTCKVCFCVYRGVKCPECGMENYSEPPKLLEETEQSLAEITLDPILRAYKDLQKEAKKTGKKPAWAMHKLWDRFGEEAFRFLPDWFVRQKSGFGNSPFQAAIKFQTGL